MKTPPEIVGITASREGMTARQRIALCQRLLMLRPDEVRHGDCVGGDEEIHGICIDLEIPVVIHPPENDKLRAFCTGAERVESPLPYLKRNRAIVAAASTMLGVPKEDVEPAPARGQGTWSTIRRARATETDLIVVWPDGKTEGPTP